ncbi:MAG: GAF domain-containing sensor histidine kinase, partial [Verrucomicrobiae bacterium]|nr:GAF domain-containing sensor histidine kinase [Verrucomicrobiae bacterium]
WLATQVLTTGATHRIRGAPNHFAMDARVWELILDVPLIADDTLVGVLNLATHSPDAWTQEHEEIAQEIAAQLALAFRQSWLFAQISAGRERLRALSLRLVDVQETERRFMAHELHDEIGQLLTGLKLTLELPSHEAAEPPGPNVSEAIAVVDELMTRVRQLSLDLRPQVLDDLGLMPALDWLFKRYLKQTGIRVHFKHAIVRRRLPSQLETAAFRIVQEALTNIARHAGVQEASVRLWLDEDILGVQIEDAGAGFDGKKALAGHASSGVAGMRERALMLGGDFTLEANPGKGTRLTVELPLNAGTAGGVR